jgi:hypothetical protein
MLIHEGKEEEDGKKLRNEEIQNLFRRMCPGQLNEGVWHKQNMASAWKGWSDAQYFSPKTCREGMGLQWTTTLQWILKVSSGDVSYSRTQ